MSFPTDDQTFQAEVLSWARHYVEIGWQVFRCYSVDEYGHCTCGDLACSNVGKHPFKGTRGFKDASRDLEQIETWFGPKAPLANIAIATGEVSDLTILDIDIGPGKFGSDTWVELTRERGEPPTLFAQTGSGGFHFGFRYSSALKTATNVLGKGIDSRNDGGYIVAAPSRHRSGGVYSWSNWGTPLIALPAHLSIRKETRGRKRKDDVSRSHYTLKDVASMLEVVPSENRDLWRNVGIILGREFSRSDEAWQLYVTWSEKWTGNKARNHDGVMREAFYELSQQSAEKELSIGTIVKVATDNGWAPKTGDVPREDFVFYAPTGKFLYRPTLSSWEPQSVDVAVSPFNVDSKLVKASDWIKANRRATSLACDPAIDQEFTHGMNCVNGALVPSVGAAVFNTYRRPTIELGDARLASPFVNHCRLLFNREGDCDQFLNYLAHLVQNPGEKLRFALLISGEQGSGKDTAIEFCCPAIGAWNVANIDPSALSNRFNEYAAATLVRISETANLQDMSKWALNESMKVLIAGSPDFCLVDPKYGHKFTVRLHCGVIITTNHLLSSIFIPEDDRRYDVIECATREEMGLADPNVRRDYFGDLWDWFVAGGANHVAAFLHERDLGKFSAGQGQRLTEAHRKVVQCGMVGDEWAADVLSEYRDPKMISGSLICREALKSNEDAKGLKGKLHHAMKRLGYETFSNPHVKDGRWKMTDGKWHTIYRLRTHQPDSNWQEEVNKDLARF